MVGLCQVVLIKQAHSQSSLRHEHASMKAERLSAKC